MYVELDQQENLEEQIVTILSLIRAPEWIGWVIPAQIRKIPIIFKGKLSGRPN